MWKVFSFFLNKTKNENENGKTNEKQVNKFKKEEKKENKIYYDLKEKKLVFLLDWWGLVGGGCYFLLSTKQTFDTTSEFR